MNVLHDQIATLDRTIQFLQVQGANIDTEIERITFFRNNPLHNWYFGNKKNINHKKSKKK